MYELDIFKNFGRKIINISILSYWLRALRALNESCSVGMKKTWLVVVLNFQKVFHEMMDLGEWPVSLFSHKTREQDIKLESDKVKAKNNKYALL